MKKIIAVLILTLFSLGSITHAQTKPAPTTQHLKKDGTPDKRYKENKTPAKPAGPLTKSGKPDMRYKANNPNAGKKKNS